MPNIGRNANAKSIGVMNRIDPPHSEMNKHVKMMIDGIEIKSVVVWKKALITVPMPVMYMWCAQTIKARKPSTTIEPTRNL